MSSWAIVTGGSSGIGAALFRRLVRDEPRLHCLAVGRRAAELAEVRTRAIADAGLAEDDAARERVRVVAADVSTEEGVAAIAAAIPTDACVRYLVHNAGVLGPIGPLADLDRGAWRQVVATNLDAPLFLTQALLPRLARCAEDHGTRARVLHVGSGAAHGAYVGWGPYCATKAGLHMLYRCLAAELPRRGVLVGSVRPGVVATDMQADIRAFDGSPDDFPMRHKFRELHEAGELERPDAVATYLNWLLSEVNDEEFSKEEWDIRSSKDDARWKEYELH